MLCAATAAEGVRPRRQVHQWQSVGPALWSSSYRGVVGVGKELSGARLGSGTPEARLVLVGGGPERGDGGIRPADRLQVGVLDAGRGVTAGRHAIPVAVLVGEQLLRAQRRAR